SPRPEGALGPSAPSGRGETGERLIMFCRRLLGWFILFQLVYIPGANVLKFLPATLPPRRDEFDDNIQLPGRLRLSALQPVLDSAVAASDRWGELTGQTQGWSLFAPHFASQSALPRV